MLCERLNFNLFCTPLPVTFMSHRGYDECVKICLDWHAKIELVILLFAFVVKLLRGDSLIQDLQYCGF